MNVARGVHQTTQTTKPARKSPAKWHKCTTSHRIAPHGAMQFVVL